MSRMEARLVKTGRLGEFNQQFQDNVDRGIFKALTRKETDVYKGPVNSISMMEPFKTGLYATTPLRICVSSSMRQPAPSGVSLNDCLLKGPSALEDLYTVTLGIREHKVAFTKDISKWLHSMSGGSCGGSGTARQNLPSSSPQGSTTGINQQGA
jgi:hypothetical protein